MDTTELKHGFCRCRLRRESDFNAGPLTVLPALPELSEIVGLNSARCSLTGIFILVEIDRKAIGGEGRGLIVLQLHITFDMIPKG